MRVRSLLVLLSFAASTSAVPAQGIAGGRLVESRTSRPLACWEVSLRPVGAAPVARTFTRDDGSFEFVSPPAGAYEYHFGAFGLKPMAIAITSTGPQMDLEATYTAELLLAERSMATELSAAPGMPEAVAGRGVPRYPAALRSSRTDGSVLVSMLVDSAGRVDSASAFLRNATHAEFEQSVRRALPDMRFKLAEDADRPRCAFIAALYEFQGGEASASASRGRCPERPIASIEEPDPVYIECQVDRTARETFSYPQPNWVPNTGEIRNGACFVAEYRYIVDSLGRPEPATIALVMTNNHGFAVAVREFIPELRYTPAFVGRRPVRQVVALKESVSFQMVASQQMVGQSFPGRFRRC